MEVKDHVHRNGQRNELRNWSMEKLAAHPAGAALYAGRYWQFLGDNKIYYSPDGIVIKPIAGDAARLALGAPKVTLTSNHLGAVFDMQQDNEMNGTVLPNVRPVQLLKVFADTLPDEVYLLNAIYQPRIELMTYRVKTQRAWYTRGGTARKSGWKHPDDATNNTAPDGWKGGGTPSFSNAGTATRRRTEWPVTLRTESFDVTQAAIGRLTYITNAYYRDEVTGNLMNNAEAVVPVDCRYKNRMCGRRKGWGGSVREARIAFRISILDPNAAKPTRLYGPMSRVLCVGSEDHAFIPGKPFLVGTDYWPTGISNPAFTPERVAFWFGERLS